jgi:predicted glutamine amidotransferase
LCRILGIVSNDGFSQGHLTEFRKLAENGRVRRGAKLGHRDGWGVVLYDGSMPRYLAREPTSALADPKYLEVSEELAKIDKGILLAHLRKVIKGRPFVENTHPFIHGKWTFAHNGTISGVSALNLPVQGTTDSEKFFRLLTNRLKRDSSFQDALAWSVSFMRRNFKYSSLNFVLSDGNVLYAFRDCNEAEDYYAMLYKRDKKAVTVSQEPLDKDNWKAIPNRNLAIVHKDLTVQIKALDSA